MCEEIRRQGKIPCIFHQKKSSIPFFEELGFEKIWKMGHCKSLGEVRWERS
ncbi:MAG: hypothetical protein ACLRMN_13725 [Mediterraneibacter gnavus]